MEERSLNKRLRVIRETLTRAGARPRVELRLRYNCPVAWESMTEVDARVRHCQACDAQVHDLTEATRSEVAALVRKHNGSFCGQVQAREDGRVVFGECTGEGPLSVARGWLIAPEPTET